MVVSSLTFGTTALACATAPELGVMIALRAGQGFAAGGFGPAAFVAIFMTARGPLLHLVLAVFASEETLGWQALFLIQAAIGAILALAAYAWAPRPKPDWSTLKTDWLAIFLLSTSLATAVLVFSQGTRRFWFENDMIVWCTAASIGATAGYVFVARFSPTPITMHGMRCCAGLRNRARRPSRSERWNST
jgi:DHA2 family multidrug resistance protein